MRFRNYFHILWFGLTIFSLLCRSRRDGHFGSLCISLEHFYAKLSLLEDPLTIVTQYLLIRNDFQLFYHMTSALFLQTDFSSLTVFRIYYNLKNVNYFANEI